VYFVYHRVFYFIHFGDKNVVKIAVIWTVY